MLIRIDDDARFAHGMMRRYDALKDPLIHLLKTGDSELVGKALGYCCGDRTPARFEKVREFLISGFDYSINTPVFAGCNPHRFFIVDGMHRCIFVYLIGAPTIVDYTGQIQPALHFAQKPIDFYSGEVNRCVAKHLSSQ